jgi:nitrogen PTS system EIIA component
LVDVEEILDRSQQTDAVEDVSISDMVPEAAIAIPLTGRTRSSVITEMSELASRTGLLWDPEKMAEAVRAREHLHPTALDNGAALLHPRRPLASILAEPLVALGRTTRGIPFGGARGTLTDIFFLICSTDDRIHLRTLARLSRLIAIAEFLPQLREASDAAAVLKVVRSHEATLD